MNTTEPRETDFVPLLKKLLMAEHFMSSSEAEGLIHRHPGIVTQGIMFGNSRLRSTAMALLMADEKPQS